MIRIVLAGEPRGKGRPRFSRKTGRTYTPEQTRSYEAQLAWAAQVAMEGRPLMEGALSARITAFLPVPASWSNRRRAAALTGAERPTKKPDLDNLIKGVMDALNSVVYKDDVSIVDIISSKIYADKPRMEIIIQKCQENLQHSEFW